MPFDDGGYHDDDGAGPMHMAILPKRLAETDVRVEDTDTHQRPYGCGHLAAADFEIHVKEHGREETKLEIPDAYKARASRCGACTKARILATATMCEACDGLILEGQQVSTIRDGKMRCIRNGCADGMELSGHWDGERIEPITINGFPSF